MSDEENPNELAGPRPDERAQGLAREPTVYERERQRKGLQARREKLHADADPQSERVFQASPARIEFKDYTLLQPEKLVLLLTNVGRQQHAFKLEPIEDEFRVGSAHQDYFEVHYEPPGKMAPGTSCKVSLKFTPQLNLDFETRLPVLTDAGKLYLPILCSYSKAVVVAPSRLVDFGDVLEGEDKELALELVNLGALPTAGRITDGFGRVLRDKTEGLFSRQQSAQGDSRSQLDVHDLLENEEADLFQELRFSKAFKVPGGGKLLLPIKYVPKKKRDWQTAIELTFENFTHSPPIRVELRGRCVDLPISVEKPVYDLEVCLLNNTYREQVVFANSGSTAMKVQVVLPKETKQFIQLNPSFGYIQARDKLKVWLKLVLLPEFAHMCQKFRVRDGEYRVPIQLHCSDQLLPVNFDLRIRVTTDKLLALPKTIDFGLLYVDTAKRVDVCFENQSDLPQFVYFYPLPKAITYEPAQIPLAVQPRERVSVGFVYRAHEVKKEDEFVVASPHQHARVVTGNTSVQQLKIPYRAAVVACPLKFSALKVDFQTLQVGEKAAHLLSVKNHDAKPFICEFFLPHFEVSGLRVAPMVFQLDKGKAVEVNVEYVSRMKRLQHDTLAQLQERDSQDPATNPALRAQLDQADKPRLDPEEDRKRKPDRKAAPAEKKKTKKELEEEEAARKAEEELRLRREEETRRRDQQLRDEFDHDAALLRLGGRLHEFEVDGFHSQHYTWLLPCYFRPVAESETARSAMFVEVSTVSTSQILTANRELIDFGEVAVGFRKVEELQVTNAGKEDAELKLGLLPLLSGFTVLNALKVVPPGKTKAVIIQFEPYNQSEFSSSQARALTASRPDAPEGEPYQQTLTIQSEQASVSVKLLGKSVKPEVALVPEDGLLHLGATVPGERIEKTFEIRNVSSFSLDFKLELLQAGLKRADGQEPFLYLPAQGTLAAKETVKVQVLFVPDRVSEKYFHVLKVDVPNQKTERRLFLKAACFPRQAFVTHFQPLEFPKPEPLPIESPLDFVRVKDSSLVIGSEHKQVFLEFPKLLGGSTVPKDAPALERKLVVGSCKLGDPKLEKPVNFDLSLLVGAPHAERRKLRLLLPRERQRHRRPRRLPGAQNPLQTRRARPIHRRHQSLQRHRPVDRGQRRAQSRRRLHPARLRRRLHRRSQAARLHRENLASDRPALLINPSLRTPAPVRLQGAPVSALPAASPA